MTSWRRSTPVAIALITMFLVIQLAIPISKLGKSDGDQRFGWQMFSTAGTPADFAVHTDSGSEEVNLNVLTAQLRADMPLTELVPPFLCDTVPGAIEVTWQSGGYSC